MISTIYKPRLDSQIKTAQDRQGEIREIMESILSRAETEKRDLGKEEDEEYKKLETEFDELQKTLKELKKEEDQLISRSRNTMTGMEILDNNGHRAKVYNRNFKAGEKPKVSFGRFLQLSARPHSVKNESEERALSNASGAVGGNMVPESLSDTLVEGLINTATVFQAGAQLVSLEGAADVYKFAKVSTVPTVSYYGEGSTISDSDPAFGQITFTPTKGAFGFIASNELLQDAPNAAEKLEQLSLQAAAQGIDSAALTGSGTSNEPTGVVNQSNINSVSFGTNGAAPTNYDEIIDGRYEILNNKGSIDNWAIVHHPRTARDFYKLKEASTNAPLNLPAILQDLRWYESQAISTTLDAGTSTGVASESVMGDFSKLWVGMRLRPMVFADPFRLSNKDQTYFRLTFRIDVQVENPEHFTLLSDIISS